MMGHQIFDERNLTSDIQCRKLPEVKEHRALNVIDYFKFAPLQYKCPDNSYLTLFDVFRFMKYNFDSKQLQGYQELVLASTIRPILILVHRLCSQNIYTEIYNIEDSESVDDKKTTINTLYHDNVNNTKQTNNQNATDSTKNKNPLPSYMIDYILFI
ncbi:uncharacterized protein LOC126908008 isoform X3 [Daktulosphaira vitifoliae]|uniref:uncharacterized protein LOC126908008 isoform X3 n=1 Tax=Daktulosphaira vitifoliae TaxID=58002 RepID=UPI0021AB066A|nr:uncharacterized protein LOC126908008 isoform X3 [Daktulosphaira vitifoliae]